MLTYRNGPQSDPFNYIYSSKGWLSEYDPPRDFPFWLNLEPTNYCQLNCLFCSRQLSRRPLGYMGLELAEAIFDEVAAFGKTAVRFTGWGEPLLSPHIKELTALVKKRGIPLKIYTNGLALTPELMDHFIELKVDDLQFSLQGLNEEQYIFNRCGSNYQKVAENITMASERRKNQEKPFLSLLTSVLENELKQEDPLKFTQRWLRLVDKVAVDFTNLNFVSKLERVKPFVSEQSKGLRRGKCVDIFLALEVKYDGSLQFCGQDSQGLDEHTIGRFGEITLRQAWHSPKMEAQRQRVGRALDHESSSVCQNCYHNTDKYDLFKNILSLDNQLKG